MEKAAEKPPLLVSSNAFKLQLSVASMISLACSGSLSGKVPNLSDGQERWYCRGQGFCLTVQLLMGGRLCANGSHQQKLAEDFGRILRDAELWTQLHLQATLTLPSWAADDLGEPRNDIIIFLSHSPSSTEIMALNNSQRHPKALQLSLADVKPPSGIPEVAITEVHLTMDYSVAPGGETKPLRKKPKRAKTVDATMEIKQASCSKSAASERLCFSQPMERTLYHTGEEVLLDFHEISPTTTQSLQAHNAFRFQNMPGFLEDVSGRQLAKRPATFVTESADSNHPPPVNDCLRLEQMVTLADVALRNLISDKPLRTPPGVSMEGAPEVRLSEICPALWSPDYLPAISQRAQLVRIISRAMSFPVFSHARSVALKDKLRRFSSCLSLTPTPCPLSSLSYILQDSENGTQALKTSERIHKALQARLWRTMQRGLYDRTAARRLAPLKVPDNYGYPGTDATWDEMLREERLFESDTVFDASLVDEADDMLYSEPDIVEEDASVNVLTDAWDNDSDENFFSDDEDLGSFHLGGHEISKRNFFLFEGNEASMRYDTRLESQVSDPVELDSVLYFEPDSVIELPSAHFISNPFPIHQEEPQVAMTEGGYSLLVEDEFLVSEHDSFRDQENDLSPGDELLFLDF